jgi:hypothetical protein
MMGYSKSVRSLISEDFYSLLEQGRRQTQRKLGLNNLTLTKYTKMISRSKKLVIPKINLDKKNAKKVFNKRKKRRY